MTHKKHWLAVLVPTLAFATGIIMSAIGGTMLLSSAAKLALFDEAPHSYINHESCRYDYNRQIKETTESGEVVEKPYQRSETEIAECITTKKEEEKNRFQNNKKQDLVDGASALIVGFFLVLFFRKRK